MNTEVSKSSTNKEVAMPMGAWGTENIKTENILIPQIYLMQGQSKGVQDEKAKVGDIVDSVNYTVLGDAKKDFKFIPLVSFDTFMVQEYDGKQWRYSRTEPVTMANEKHRKEWESIDPVTKKQLKWTYELKFYVLPLNEYKTALPHVLGFRSTSLKAGKALTNHFVRCRQDNIPPASYVMKLTSNKQTKDSNTFFVFEVSQGEKATAEQQTTAWKWYQMIKAGQTNVHVSEESTGGSTPVMEEDIDV